MAIESSFKNMVLTLGVITLISSLCLAGVFELTKDTIRLSDIRVVNNGIAEVVPPFDNNPYEDAFRIGTDSLLFYPAKMGDQLVGMAVQAISKDGFSGDIELMVGFLPDGTILKVVTIKHAETPGLGDKIENSKSKFSMQFEGKHPNTFKISLKKDGGEIDGITASTISSRAYCNAINIAYKVFQEDYLKGEAWDGVSGATH